MNPRALSKEDARAVLWITARKVWFEMTRLAQHDNRPQAAARAEECFEAALKGIEEWLDAVYERGLNPSAADAEFLSGSDRKFGLGFLRPSEVVDRALATGWV